MTVPSISSASLFGISLVLQSEPMCIRPRWARELADGALAGIAMFLGMLGSMVPLQLSTRGNALRRKRRTPRVCARKVDESAQKISAFFPSRFSEVRRGARTLQAGRRGSADEGLDGQD
jgi:hypothetical protein